MATSLYKRLLGFVITHKYISLGILILLVWFSFSVALTLISENMSLWDSFWSILVFLTSGLEDQGIPKNASGDPTLVGGERLLAVFAVLLGALTIGGFVATLASDLIKNIVHGQNVTPKSGKLSLANHVVIAGYTDKTKNIVRELRSPVIRDKPPIVIVTETNDHIPIEAKGNYKRVYSIFGTLIKDEFMKLADLRNAGTLIILNESDRKNSDSKDSGTFLTALAARSYCPNLHIIAELDDLGNKRHFNRIGVTEIIHSKTLTHSLIAQSILSPGTYEIFRSLLTFDKEGNEVYRIKATPKMVGQSFSETAAKLLDTNVIAVAIVRKDHNPSVNETHLKNDKRDIKAYYIDKFLINPPPGTRIHKKDELLVISLERPNIK